MCANKAMLSLNSSSVSTSMPPFTALDRLNAELDAIRPLAQE